MVLSFKFGLWPAAGNQCEKNQIDKFKHAEIQSRHKMTIYPSKKFKIAYLHIVQTFPFMTRILYKNDFPCLYIQLPIPPGPGAKPNMGLLAMAVIVR